VSFALAPTGAGLFVERVEWRSGKERTVHAAIFRSKESFERWCDGDPIRFDDPLLYANLKRGADELFASRR
jgi:hypothetical protein